MKAKYIFKTLAFAMLIPAMLLTNACSDINENEDTNKKGFTLPVTVNVTRQSEDATTKATYNETTKKLEFSEGDKLFVRGTETTAGSFAGTLTWQSGGTFSGTISTEKGYAGTADKLFTAASMIQAILLPNGYETDEYDYIYFIDHGYDYTTEFAFHNNKAFASSKATAVEQFSCEYASAYNSGFALSPQNAILNFTIKGLTPSTNVTATLAKGSSNLVTGSVTIDGSGTATFAVAVQDGSDFKDISLTVDGKAITLTDGSSKTLEAGHIYNIARTVLTLTSPAVGQVICSDGKNHTYNSSETNNGLPEGVTAIARICHVDGTGHGLALTLTDEGQMNWDTAMATCAARTPVFSGGKWMLPSETQWNTMLGEDSAALLNSFTSVGGTNMGEAYWTSTEYTSENYKARILFQGKVSGMTLKSNSLHVRACLAF